MRKEPLIWKREGFVMPTEGGIRIGRSVRVPASAFTLDGFRQWMHSARAPKRGRFTFIGGEVRVEMTPEELLTHNDPKRDLIVALTLEARQFDLGQVFIDGVLLVNEQAQVSTEPDLMFCKWGTLESGRAAIAEAAPGSGRFVEVQGSPDLVVEIVSRSSVTKDKRDLREAYYQAGIPEYWLLDARAKVDLQVLIASDTGYENAPASPDGFQASPVMGKQVKLTRAATRGGGYSYTLHLRPSEG